MSRRRKNNQNNPLLHNYRNVKGVGKEIKSDLNLSDKKEKITGFANKNRDSGEIKVWGEDGGRWEKGEKYHGNIDKYEKFIAKKNTDNKDNNDNTVFKSEWDDLNLWKTHRGESGLMKVDDDIEKSLDDIEYLLTNAFIDGLGVIVDFTIPEKMRSAASSGAKSAAASAATIALAKASATKAFNSILDEFMVESDDKTGVNKTLTAYKDSGLFPGDRLKIATTNEQEQKNVLIKSISDFFDRSSFNYPIKSEKDETVGGGNKTRKSSSQYSGGGKRRRKYKKKTRKQGCKRTKDTRKMKNIKGKNTKRRR